MTSVRKCLFQGSKENHLHVSRKLDFIVSQATFLMGNTEGTDTINKEAVSFDWALEPLFATPCHARKEG